jgi:hypothetical protein
VLQVDVLITSIDDLQHSFTLLSQAYSWEDEIGLVKVESGEAGLSVDWHFHIASGNIDFSLVEKELEFLLVFSWVFS